MQFGLFFRLAQDRNSVFHMTTANERSNFLVAVNCDRFLLLEHERLEKHRL
jgi:hypothetical protein